MLDLGVVMGNTNYMTELAVMEIEANEELAKMEIAFPSFHMPLLPKMWDKNVFHISMYMNKQLKSWPSYPAVIPGFGKLYLYLVLTLR